MERVQKSESAPVAPFTGQTGSAADLGGLVLPHFTPAEAVEELRADLLDPAAAREWVLRKIHREHGPRCPECGRQEFRTEVFYEGRRLRCPGCGVQFTASTGTILAGTSLDFREIYLLGLLLGLGLSDSRISERMDINRKTVADWRRKLSGK